MGMDERTGGEWWTPWRKIPARKWSLPISSPGLSAGRASRIYTINTTTSLVSTAFAPLVTEVVSTPPENTYIDLTTSAESVKFYRIELE
jgi:hypothetical protein